MSAYLGNLEEGRKDVSCRFNNDIMIEAQKASNVPLYLFFWKKYNVFPCTIEPQSEMRSKTKYIPYSLAMKLLKEKYNHDIENDITQEMYSILLKMQYVSSQISEIADGVIVHFMDGRLQLGLEPRDDVACANHYTGWYHVFSSYKIYYLPSKTSFAKDFIQSLPSMSRKSRIPESNLQMICKNGFWYYLSPVKIEKPTISDLKLHYGEEFGDVHEKIMKKLKKKSAYGMILLYGLPGCGKTQYIRHLIHEKTEKQVIYVPPDQTSSISSPEFFSFMLKNTNSILIIEDAENIINTRESEETTSQAVANLLNLSDGLLADSLNQIIIATFNCELSSIDRALLRRGRLIAKYEFTKLSVERAQKLSDQLGFTKTITEPMTLADIYDQKYTI